MTIEELSEASELLRQAAEATDDADSAETLLKQADQLDDLAGRDRGPDHGRIALALGRLQAAQHGRIARHQHAIRHVQGKLDPETAEVAGEAYERLNAYRSTIEGV